MNGEELEELEEVTYLNYLHVTLKKEGHSEGKIRIRIPTSAIVRLDKI